MNLISGNDTWALWAVLFIAAAIGLWAERSRAGARLSGAMVTLLVTFTLSNLGIIPSQAPVYEAVWSYLVPLAIPLLLLHANLYRIVREAGAMLLAFGLGALGTVLGVLLGYVLLPLGEHAWQLAAVFSATYIGGSMNFASTADAVGLHNADLLSAGVAADNLMMSLYFLLLFTLPSIRSLRDSYPEPLPPQRYDSTTEMVRTEARKGAQLDLPQLATALAISAGLCAIGFAVEKSLAIRGAAILLITAATVLLATVLARPLQRLKGGHDMGMLLMQVFFAAIGASAHIGTVISVGPVLFVFAAIILGTHLVFLLGAGYLLRLSLPELLLASNANMGGPTTAAAMAAARRWQHLMVPAILCGTLGYATATLIGSSLGTLLR